MRLNLFSTALLGLALSAPVLAAPITIAHSDTQTTTFTPGTLQFTIPGFDASLGDLTSVMFQYTATLEATGTIENGSSEDGVIDGAVSATFSINGPAPIGTVLILNPAAPLGPQPIGAGQTLTYSPAITGTDSDTFTFTDPSDLLLFIAGGNLTFNGAAASQLAPIANFTPVTIEFDQTGSATLEVFYTYEPTGIPQIPEPSTLSLLGAGGLLLGFSRLLRHRA